MTSLIRSGTPIGMMCGLVAALGLAPGTLAAQGYSELAILRASDAMASSAFGHSAAVSGDTLIVGADAVGNFVGAAYLFDRDRGGASNWGEAAKVTASDAQDQDSFGRSVGVSGDTAIVGAPGEDGGAGDPINRAGAAYVFQRDLGGADNWGEVKKLEPHTPFGALRVGRTTGVRSGS